MLWPFAVPLAAIAVVTAIAWLRVRPVHFPRPEEVDLDAEHARAQAALDAAGARRLVAEQDGIRVYRCRVAYCPYVGYLSVSTFRADAEAIRSYVHERAAITKINEAYDGGRVLGSAPDGGETAIYATMRFRSQSLLSSPRDGVAVTSVRRGADGTIGVLTYSVDHPDCPLSPAYARYRNYASYDRITSLGDGRCRVEHMMVLDPNGWILPSFWNLFLTRANARVYLAEAKSLRRLLEGQGAPAPATRAGRGRAA